MKGFTVGIHVLVKKSGKYLILKRSADDPDHPGDWDLPGGGMHLGEQPDRAAQRETREEAGVKVTITKILSTYAIPYGQLWSVELTVEAKYVSGRIKLSPEHSEYRWVTRRQLKEIKHPNLPIKSIFRKIGKSDFY